MSETKGSLQLVGSDKPVELNDLLTQVKSAKVGKEVTTAFWKIEPGEVKRVIYLGMKKVNAINGEPGEKTDAVEMVDADNGEAIISGDAVMVTTFDSIVGPKAYEISCTGTKPGKKAGTYKTFQINELVF